MKNKMAVNFYFQKSMFKNNNYSKQALKRKTKHKY